MLTLFFVDAGPSELMATLLTTTPTIKYQLLTTHNAPAISIFKKYHLESITILDSNHLQSYLQESHLLITGTSWQTTLHFELYELAQKKNLPIYALMDHWVNYDTRFVHKHKNYASYISGFLVLDEHALTQAQKHHLTPTVAIQNQLLINLQKNFTPKKNRSTLLFLSEPTHNVALKTYKDSNYWHFNEYTALHDICKNFALFECDSLTIRLHPSDEREKYRHIINCYPELSINVQTPQEIALNDAMSSAQCVIGFDTYALYVAHVLGVDAISYLPSENRHCSLALPKTQIIKNLADVKLQKKRMQPLDVEHFGQSFHSFIEGIS